MRWTFMIVALAMLLAGCNVTGALGGKTKPAFRNAHWGMTKEEVVASEFPDAKRVYASDVFLGEYATTKLEETNDELYYTTELFGERVVVLYAFEKNRLIYGKYMFANNYFTEATDHDRIKKISAEAEKQLTEKYGKPETRKVTDTDLGTIVDTDWDVTWSHSGTFIWLWSHSGLKYFFLTYSDQKHNDEVTKAKEKSKL